MTSAKTRPAETTTVPSTCPEHGDHLDVVAGRTVICTAPGCRRAWTGVPPSGIGRR